MMYICISSADRGFMSLPTFYDHVPRGIRAFSGNLLLTPHSVRGRRETKGIYVPQHRHDEGMLALVHGAWCWSGGQ